MIKDIISSGYPFAIRHDGYTMQSELFINGVWVAYGKIETYFVPALGRVVPVLPDIEPFLREYDDMGVREWFSWGPRVN